MVNLRPSAVADAFYPSAANKLRAMVLIPQCSLPAVTAATCMGVTVNDCPIAERCRV